MTRILHAALVAFALAIATPAVAANCSSDCASCPHKGAGAKCDKPGTDAACACQSGKECTCGTGCKCEEACKGEKGCKCGHCSGKKDEKTSTPPVKG